MAGQKPNTSFNPAVLMRSMLAGLGKGAQGLRRGGANTWRALATTPGKTLWPLAVGVGVLAAFYFGARALLGAGQDVIPADRMEPSGEALWAVPEAGALAAENLRGWLTKAGFVVIALATLAACAWFLD